MSLDCDNDGSPAARIVSNVATGEQSFYCDDCFGKALGIAPPPEFAKDCEMCGVEPTSTVLSDLATGVKLSLGKRCYLVTGRMAWLNAPAEEWETLDEMAESALGSDRPAPQAKKGKGKKLAVVKGDSDGPPLAEDSNMAPVAVGATADANNGTAPDPLD